jgi:hypothetical protein
MWLWWFRWRIRRYEAELQRHEEFRRRLEASNAELERALRTRPEGPQ